MVRRSGRRPELVQLSFFVRLFEEMARQDGETIEESFFDAIGLGELENERVRVEFVNGDRFAADNQQIALRGVDIFVEVDAKGEEDVIGIERMAVREAQTFAQRERVMEAVRGNLPGLGESGFGELGGTVDVNEVGLHDGDDFPGGSVRGGQGIQGFRFVAEGDDEASAWVADFTGQGE